MLYFDQNVSLKCYGLTLNSSNFGTEVSIYYMDVQ